MITRLLLTLGTAAPSPSASAPPDPFNPDVTIFPDPPGWLFPAVMVVFGIGLSVVVVMLVMWSMARKKAAALGPAPRKDWVDLNEVDAEARTHIRRAKTRDKDDGTS